MMTDWLRRVVQATVEWLKPIGCRPVCVRHTAARGRRRILIAMTGALLIGSAMAGAVCAEDAMGPQGKTARVVAAGFGFQNADSSTITVKTYDADSGRIISNDTYELDIKEEGPVVSPPPRERIFAGGVGIDADGLSEFTLRVYDATDGRFLWEGRLNLRVTNTDTDTIRVGASVRPRAFVKQVGRGPVSQGQPYFVLRVVDPETGRLVWFDRFSTDPGSVRIERIGRSVVGMDGAAPRDVDFRILMFDEESRRVLWEDQVTSSEEAAEAGSSSTEDDAESILNESTALHSFPIRNI
jgi:hypothetical protein